MKIASFVGVLSLLLSALCFSGESVAATKSDWRAYRELSPVARPKMNDRTLQAYISKSILWLSRQETKHQDRLRPKRRD